MDKVLPAHVAIHEGADDNAVEHSDGSSLGRGKQTGIDAAQNNDGHQQSPDTVLESGGDLLGSDTLGTDIAALLGNDIVDDDNNCGHQQAGADATDEHFTDGGVCQRAVHNHGVAGGDDQTDGTGGGDHSGGEGLIIVALLHLGHHNGADSGGGSGGGTGDRAKEGGGQRCHVSKAAGHPAHQRCGHIGQALGNAAAGHHVTGKHEEGDCQQGEGVDGAERFLHQIDNGDCACGHNRREGGNGQGERNGDANE